MVLCMVLCIASVSYAETIDSSFFSLTVDVGKVITTSDSSSDFYLRCKLDIYNEQVDSIIVETFHAYVSTQDEESKPVYRIYLPHYIPYDIVMFTAVDSNGNYLDSIQFLCTRENEHNIHWRQID